MTADADLFGDAPSSVQDKEWVGMPEFKNEKIEAFAKIIVRVDSQQDLDALSIALGQKLTRKTKSAWFPFRPHRSGLKKPKWKSG